MGIPELVLGLHESLRLKFVAFLLGYNVTMLNTFVEQSFITFSSMIRRFFDVTVQITYKI